MIRAKRSNPKSRASKATPVPTMSPEEAYTRHSFVEYQAKNPLDFVTIAEFAKKSSEDWKSLTANEQLRFKIQVQSGQAPDYSDDDFPSKPVMPSASGTKRRKRTPKDPNAPKRNLSAFFHFSSEERPRIKAAYPNYTMGETAKELGVRWAALGAEAKKPFQSKAQADKERYTREKEIYAIHGKVPLDLSAKTGGTSAAPATTAPVSQGPFPEPVDEASEDEPE